MYFLASGCCFWICLHVCILSVQRQDTDCTDLILKKLTEELKWLWNKVISSMKKKRAKPLNSIQRNRKTTVDLPKPPFASPATVISSKPKQITKNDLILNSTPENRL